MRNLTAELILKPCERCPSQVSLRGEACSLAFGRDLRTSEERLECSEEFAEVRLGARMHDPLLRKRNACVGCKGLFSRRFKGSWWRQADKEGMLDSWGEGLQPRRAHSWAVGQTSPQQTPHSESLTSKVVTFVRTRVA